MAQGHQEMHHLEQEQQEFLEEFFVCRMVQVNQEMQHQEKNQEVERLLEQYQTRSRWIAWQHKSGNLREEKVPLAKDEALGVARSQGQLGSKFTDHQCQGGSKIHSLRKCPRKTAVPPSWSWIWRKGQGHSS